MVAIDSVLHDRGARPSFSREPETEKKKKNESWARAVLPGEFFGPRLFQVAALRFGRDKMRKLLYAGDGNVAGLLRDGAELAGIPQQIQKN